MVAQQAFSDLAIHFLNRYDIMALRVISKFDLARLASTVGSTVISTLEAPDQSQLGYCDSVSVEVLFAACISL